MYQVMQQQQAERTAAVHLTREVPHRYIPIPHRYIPIPVFVTQINMDKSTGDMPSIWAHFQWK